MSDPTPLVEMRGISKYYPGVVALDNVDFSLARGEVHALVGESGAGKSTLMKILAGAEPKSRGEILLDGQPVTIDSPHRAMDLGISIIYQEFNLVPHLSAAENIFLGREPTRLFPGWVDFRKVYGDRKSTRLNSSHVAISYAVFCLKKKKQIRLTYAQSK